MRLPDYKLIEDAQTSIDVLVVRKIVCETSDGMVFYDRGNRPKDAVKITIYADEVGVKHLGDER